MRWLLLFLAVCFAQPASAQMTMTGVGGAFGAGPSTCATIIAQVSGVIACWNADEGVATTGSSVTSWTDQTSNGYVLGLNTLSAESAPTSPTFGATSYNSKAGITFSAASGNYLATSNNVVSLAISSWFIAASVTSSSATSGRFVSYQFSTNSDFGTAATIAALLRDGANQNFSWFNNNVEGAVTAFTYSTPSRFGVVFNGSTGTPYLNNSAGSSAGMANALGSGTSNIISVGNGANSGGARLDGVVRRIVVTSTAVSSTDRSNIDTWLQQ